MYTIQQKKEIATRVQEILKSIEGTYTPDTNQEIQFTLRVVSGAGVWEYTDIYNNHRSKGDIPSIPPNSPEL